MWQMSARQGKKLFKEIENCCEIENIYNALFAIVTDVEKHIAMMSTSCHRADTLIINMSLQLDLLSQYAHMKHQKESARTIYIARGQYRRYCGYIIGLTHRGYFINGCLRS